jgi:hypothetical protein
MKEVNLETTVGTSAVRLISVMARVFNQNLGKAVARELSKTLYATIRVGPKANSVRVRQKVLG